MGTVASFSCSSGFSLSGSESTICEISGHWMEQNQMCKGGKQRNFDEISIVVSFH